MMKTVNPDIPLSIETAGILILACAVFIFAMNQKYSLIVNRIRHLKGEKLKLIDSKSNPSLKAVSGNDRSISNTELQISHLIHRISMVRFAILCFALAILLMVVHVVLIGVRPAEMVLSHYWLTIGFLFGGLLAMSAGIVIIAIETWKGYRVVRIEISEIGRSA